MPSNAEPKPVLRPTPADSEHGEPGPFLVPRPARQINLFTGEPEIPSAMVEAFPPGVSERVLEEGINVLSSPEGMAIHISGWGAYVGKKSGRLVLRKKGEESVLWQAPLDRLCEVQLSSRGVNVTSDVLTELADRGIRVTFLSGSGRPVAQVFHRN